MRAKHFIALILALLALHPVATLAVGEIPTAPADQINLSIGIGGVNKVTDLADYISIIYKWMVGAGMVIAAFMIAVGGFQYVASAGNPKMVGQAKSRIINSLTGLLLVLSSYVLLYSISPDFVNLKLPDIRKIENIPLASDICGGNNPEEREKYSCGQVLTGAEGGQPSGKSCYAVGSKDCGTGKCVDVSQKNSEVSFGSGTAKSQYMCLHHSKCAVTSCEDITPETFGEEWKAYCDADICNDMPGLESGCISVEADVNGRTVKGCKTRGDVGSYCTLTPCKVGLLCNTATTPATCVQPRDVEYGEACKRDSECKSGFCNKYVGTSLTGGLCAPVGGYKVLSGNKRFEDCDPAKPQMCGDGWRCVDDAPNNPVDSRCSDLDTGSPCESECAKATDECKEDRSTETLTLRKYCVPRTPAPAAP